MFSSLNCDTTLSFQVHGRYILKYLKYSWLDTPLKLVFSWVLLDFAFDKQNNFAFKYWLYISGKITDEILNIVVSITTARFDNRSLGQDPDHLQQYLLSWPLSTKQEIKITIYKYNYTETLIIRCNRFYRNLKSGNSFDGQLQFY